ncbi:solute carrier family 25 member 47-B isoform X3 [Cetorhinus maximus]
MYLLDFLAGWVAGGLATAVGYPLDTIKVRIQTQHMYSGVWHCIQSTYQREKVYGFYKGMALPVLSVSVCGSVCFGTYRNCLNFLSHLRQSSSEVKPARLDVFIAGCSAGTAEAVVFAPIDLIKIRQQNQTHPHQSYQGPLSRDLLSKPKYRGSIHCLITVIKEEGVLGLYRGITALWLRDIPCFGLYFLVYSIFTEWLTPQGQHKPGIYKFGTISRWDSHVVGWWMCWHDLLDIGNSNGCHEIPNADGWHGTAEI